MVDQAEIHRKVASGEVKERREAAGQLSDNFADLSDKSEAWEDLHRLVGDEDSDVRWHAAYALESAFQYVPDKDEAWEDLIRLTGDEDSDVRSRAADALGSAFQHAPDKTQAGEDLHRLTGAEDRYVRLLVAYALESTFQYVPDKDGAWEDLHRLTGDEDSYVRVFANHSLGRASIFRATEAESEDDFESELKNAIEFFERSSKEKTYFNPSRFCLPFYRSFYTVTFEKAGTEDEVKRYLAEAKSASKGSKNRETLLEAVASLANALTEAHNATDFDTKKSELNSYRRYCDRAADLIGNAAEGAPGAARVLQRGLPIIDDRIKKIIREIQEKAEAVCRETRGTGTPYEPLGIEVNKWAGELSDRDYLQNERIASRIADILGEFCNLLPEGKREYPCKIVKELRDESEPKNKLIDIATALSYLEPCIESQLPNAAKPTTDKTGLNEPPSQNTSHSTTVIVKSGSTVVIPHTETKSGDVTVNTAVTKESQPDKQPARSPKRTAIEISADIAVHVLVYTILHHFAEDLMPAIAPVLVITALITLILIIRNAKS
jgi:HEAT repeat protein